MVPKKETESVHIEVIFKVGSRYETPDIAGIAHFLEHTVTDGTKKRKAAIDIQKEIDQVGGFSNAYTSREITGYFVRVPAEKAKLGIDILSDMLYHPKLTSKDINKEKGVIIEEIRMYEDNPTEFGARKFIELILGDNSLGSDVIGNVKTVGKIDRKKLIDFKSKFYTPNNTVIAIGGRIKEKETRELLNKYFGKAGEKKENIYEKNNILQLTPKVKIIKKDVDQAKLFIGFRSFGRDRSEQDREIAELLLRILGGTASSILWDEIREKRGLAYDIGSFSFIFDETGFLAIESGLNLSKLKEALKLIFKILKEAKEKGFKEKDIKRAKDFNMGRLALSIENAPAWATGIARDLLYEKNIDLPEDIIRRIKKIKNSDLKRIAREVFRPERLNMVIVGPIDPSKEKEYLKLIKL